MARIADGQVDDPGIVRDSQLECVVHRALPEPVVEEVAFGVEHPDAEQLPRGTHGVPPVEPSLERSVQCQARNQASVVGFIGAVGNRRYSAQRLDRSWREQRVARLDAGIDDRDHSHRAAGPPARRLAATST